MSEPYYKPCRELDICNELIEKYFNTQQYEKCFEGHLALAKQGYPLAECQVGYFYYDGLGVEKNLEKAVYWTRRAADHGDRDGQCNLAWFHEDAIGVERDLEQAIFWYRKAALQEHDLAIEKCKELGVDLNAPTVDREVIRKDLQCRIYPLGYLERYKYTVICTSYQGKWVLSRHKKRATWETQGGHIEEGETPLECARRELFEESGIQDADIYPVCDYWGFNSQACSNGMVFLAVVHSLGELPESEMKEIKAFDVLPSALTYPQTSPKLYAEAEKVLKSIEVSAMAVVLCNGKILSTNEMIYGKETLSLPKGHQEENEALIETAIRECFEETNISLAKENLRRKLTPYSYQFSTPSNKLVRKTIVPFLFEVNQEGNPIPKEERMISVQWMDVAEFLEKCTHENVKSVVKEI